MSEPAPTYLNTGDVNDDDAEILDNLIESDAVPPTPDELPIVRGPETPVYAPKPTRLLTHTAKYQSSAGPVMVVPEDPRRQHLVIHVHGSNDIFLSQDRSMLTMGMSGAFVVAAPGTLELPGYTGALWAGPDPDLSPTDNFSYSIAVVTS